MLGDTTYDDQSYTGDAGDSLLSIQYYRNKASEFQAVLEALDQTALSMRMTLDTVADDPAAVQTIQDLLAEYDGKKTQLVMCAEAINAASSVSNSLGLRFPQLSIPSGLAGIPLAVAGAVAAAIAVAVTLIVWGKDWMARSYQSQQTAQALALISDPVKRDAVASQIALTTAAMQKADNPLGQVASMVKLVAIAAVAFFAYRAYTQLQRRGS